MPLVLVAAFGDLRVARGQICPERLRGLTPQKLCISQQSFKATDYTDEHGTVSSV
jgi:hypothetical protein